MTYQLNKMSSLVIMATSRSTGSPSTGIFLRQIYSHPHRSFMWRSDHGCVGVFSATNQKINLQYGYDHKRAIIGIGTSNMDTLYKNYSTESKSAAEVKPNQPVDNKPTEEPKKKGFFAFAKFMVKDVLIPGCKELWYDFKASRANKKKLKANNYDYTKLTRAEYYKIVQAGRDLRKAFPLVFIFMLPASGAYLAPLFIIISPRLALSPQFYSERQRIDFPQLDINSMRKGYPLALENLSEVADKINAKELNSLCKKILEKHHPSNEEIQEVMSVFDNDSLKLSNLSYKHIAALSRSWFMLYYLPSALLALRLKGSLKEIKLDDEALSREGLEELSHKDLKKACFDRGLNATDLSEDEMSTWLKDWVNLSVAYKGEDLSFFAHLISFKSTNYGKRE